MRGRPGALLIRRCFVDTSAYFALSEHTDANHHASLAIAGWLADQHVRLLTTNFILAEIHALLLSRMGRDVASQALFDIDRSSTTIVRVSLRDEQRGREILARYTDIISAKRMQRALRSWSAWASPMHLRLTRILPGTALSH